MKSEIPILIFHGTLRILIEFHCMAIHFCLEFLCSEVLLLFLGTKEKKCYFLLVYGIPYKIYNIKIC